MQWHLLEITDVSSAGDMVRKVNVRTYMGSKKKHESSSIKPRSKLQNKPIVIDQRIGHRGRECRHTKLAAALW
jgi:hypothetical protein